MAWPTRRMQNDPVRWVGRSLKCEHINYPTSPWSANPTHPTAPNLRWSRPINFDFVEIVARCASLLSSSCVTEKAAILPVRGSLLLLLPKNETAQNCMNPHAVLNGFTLTRASANPATHDPQEASAFIRRARRASGAETRGPPPARERSSGERSARGRPFRTRRCYSRCAAGRAG